MKPALVSIVAFYAAVSSVIAQGFVGFNNSGGSPVYVCDETSAYLAPVGSAFQLALYYAPDGVSDEAQFTQIGAAVGFAPFPGYFAGGTRIAPTSVSGDWAMFQVRGWETAYGTTYEDVASGGIGRTGKSNIMRGNTADPNSSEPIPSVASFGLQSFVIASPTCIPEPHVMNWALWISALLFALRFFARQQTMGP